MSRISAINALASAAKDAATNASNGDALGIAGAFAAGLAALVEVWTDEDDNGASQSFASDVEDWLSARSDDGSRPRLGTDQ